MPEPPARPIAIRPLRERDFDAFRECLDVVARERVYLGLTEAPPRGAAHRCWEEALARGCPHFVAVDGRRVVGWCDMHLNGERPGFRHVGRLGLGVRPEYRGGGIGRRLMEVAIEAARRLGLERIELDVYASNRAALRLYERMGFVRERVKRKAQKLGGKYDDVVLMALFLCAGHPFRRASTNALANSGKSGGRRELMW